MENASVIVCEKSSECEMSTGFVQWNVPAQSWVDVSGCQSSQCLQNRIRELRVLSFWSTCHTFNSAINILFYSLLTFIQTGIVDSD